jgi:hypothetical protein
VTLQAHLCSVECLKIYGLKICGLKITGSAGQIIPEQRATTVNHSGAGTRLQSKSGGRTSEYCGFSFLRNPSASTGRGCRAW